MPLPIKIKVCGMKYADNILDVAAFKPDYLGFIEYQSSPRFVQSHMIPDLLPAHILRVGVFVNAEPEVLLKKGKGEYDLLQLHGNESVDLVKQLKDNGIKVIKVFSVDDDFDFNVTKAYVDLADYFMFDTKGKLYGGNAKIFNWDMLRHYDQEVPFFLSGGLSAENLDRINELEHMNLHAIDLNSGVEISHGVKDVEKLKRVYALMQTYNQPLKS
ncbi:MAG: phosphoribosylanthranilate isomerase [Chryseolinea sp.]